MAKSRRKAREAALRAIYGLEIGHITLDEALAQLAEEELGEELELFAGQLVKGVNQNRRAIDAKLASFITEWDYDRIAAVDRNVKRIAAFELYHMPNIPPAVTINEAIEIGKRFSTAESGKFINGVLGRVLKDTPKSNWIPPETVEVEEKPEPEAEPELETEILDPESAEAKRLAKIGGWKLRSEGDKD